MHSQNTFSTLIFDSNYDAKKPPTSTMANVLKVNEKIIAPPPQHLLGDYVEMVYLGVVILIGTTINAHVFRKLLKEHRRKANAGKNNVGFLLLKINLNLSDLLILLVHAFGKLIWLAEYEWRFGDMLCRIFNFLSMFTLYLSSNIVVCIALDRLHTVIHAKKPIASRKKQMLIRAMVALAWFLATVWSLPQLYYWRTINVFPLYPGGWIQCSDIWSIERYESITTSSFFHSEFMQHLYNLTHLFFVFYGPLLLLIICYLFIFMRLLRFAKSTQFSTDLNEKRKSGFSLQSSANVHVLVAAPTKISIGATFPYRTCRAYIEKRLSLSSQPRRIKNRKSSTTSCVLMSRMHSIQKYCDENASNSGILSRIIDDISGISIQMSRPIFTKTIKRTPSMPLDVNEPYQNERQNKKKLNYTITRQATINSTSHEKERFLDSDSIATTALTSAASSSSLKAAVSILPSIQKKNTYFSNIYIANIFLRTLRKFKIHRSREKPEKYYKNCAIEHHISTEKIVEKSTNCKHSIQYAPEVVQQCVINAENENILASHTIEEEHYASTSTLNAALPLNAKRVPLWRRQMKSRVFRTTLLVIVAHVILWLPYNSYALMKYVNIDLYTRINEKANVLKDLQLLITIINPFLYGFRQR